MRLVSSLLHRTIAKPHASAQKNRDTREVGESKDCKEIYSKDRKSPEGTKNELKLGTPPCYMKKRI
jgi:hypothetical protein